MRWPESGAAKRNRRPLNAVPFAEGRHLTTIVSYGAGTNSTAMLIGMQDRGERPDAILFADTGGERPATYDYVAMFSAWLVTKGFPAITTVRKDGPTLEADCLARKALPSVAYGFKSCSDHYKIRPQAAWLKAWQPAIDAWARGERVVRCIGFDADEPYRADGKEGDAKFQNRYPLIEWDWGRIQCIDAIAMAGLPQPGKSSCFFCPNSKPQEIIALPPDLKARALAMEANHETGVKGLGRTWSWRNVIESDAAQIKLFPDPPAINCGCYDGEAA